MRFWNKYAFCYVAIYGQPFLTAGRCVCHLFEHKGLATLLNDDVTSVVLAMCVFIGAGLGALASGLGALLLVGSHAALPCAVGGAIVSGGASLPAEAAPTTASGVRACPCLVQPARTRLASRGADGR